MVLLRDDGGMLLNEIALLVSPSFVLDFAEGFVITVLRLVNRDQKIKLNMASAKPNSRI